MPVGDYFECFYRNPIARMLYRVFGTDDLHAHYRLRPMLDYFRKQFAANPGQTLRILEIGSGSGQNLFELFRMGRIEAVGYDLDPEHVSVARLVSDERFGGKIPFILADAAQVAETSAYDYVLFMDILEHVHQPEQIIRNMDRCLTVGGAMVVSVPTPRYPQVFGREMHERIGHLVDGYTAETLNRLFPSNYRLEHVRYTTGLVAGALCGLQTRFTSEKDKMRTRWLLSLPLLSLQRLDPMNGEGRSCSLFAVFRKTASVEEGGRRELTSAIRTASQPLSN